MTIAAVGSPMNSYLGFKFVSAGITDLVWSLRAPNAVGQYEIRLFLNNDFSQLAAVSSPLTVEVQ